jgi:hypothetical protein
MPDANPVRRAYDACSGIAGPRGRHGGFAEMIFVVTVCVAIGRDALADISRV